MAAENTSGTKIFTGTTFGADEFILDREIREIIAPFVDYKFMDFIFNTGYSETRKVATGRDEVHHYEEDDLYTVPTIVGTSTGGATAGAKTTFTINAIGSSGNYVNPFQKGKIVRIGSLAAGWKSAYVDSYTLAGNGQHGYTVTPIGGAVRIAPADAAAGMEVRHISMAMADGAYFPESELSKVFKLSTKIQTFAAAFKRHLRASADRSVVKVNGKEYMFIRGMNEVMTRLEVAIALQSLIGPTGDNVTDPLHPDGNNTYSVLFNEGLRSRIATQQGMRYDYGASFDYADAIAIDKLIDGVHGPREYFLQLGIDLDHGWDQAFYDKTDKATSFAAFMQQPSNPGKSNETAKQLAASFGFRTVTVGSRTFHAQKCDALSARNLTAGAGEESLGFAIPHEVYKASSTREGFNKGETKSFDAMCWRYKNNGIDGSRMSRTIPQGPAHLGADSQKETIIMEGGLQYGMVRKFLELYT
jgi:hypothetical protein